MKLFFTIWGPPSPKQRPRMTRRGVVFTPVKTLEHEARWAAAARQAMAELEYEWPLAADYKLVVAFYMPTKRMADVDNLVKCADGLNCVTFYDDVMISDIVASRRYDKDNPRTEVTLEVTREMTEAEALKHRLAYEKKMQRRAARRKKPSTKRPRRRKLKS